MQLDVKWLFTQIVMGDNFALVHISLKEATASLHQGFCNQGVSWPSLLDELKNFTTNIFLKLVC